MVDDQTVSKADDLTDNAFVKWKNGITLEATAGIPLTGGENGEANGAAHQAYLDQLPQAHCPLSFRLHSDDMRIKSAH